MNSNSTDKKEIRKFGLVAFLFFGGLCGLGIWTQKPLPTYLFGTLCFLGLCFILFPAFTRPIYSAWLKVAHFIGRMITTLMLALAYYLVITPSGLIKRLFGGRPLPVKPDKKAVTYWVDRAESTQPVQRFTKRF